MEILLEEAEKRIELTGGDHEEGEDRSDKYCISFYTVQSDGAG